MLRFVVLYVQKASWHVKVVGWGVDTDLCNKENHTLTSTYYMGFMYFGVGVSIYSHSNFLCIKFGHFFQWRECCHSTQYPLPPFSSSFSCVCTCLFAYDCMSGFFCTLLPRPVLLLLWIIHNLLNQCYARDLSLYKTDLKT